MPNTKKTRLFSEFSSSLTNENSEAKRQRTFSASSIVEFQFHNSLGSSCHEEYFEKLKQKLREPSLYNSETFFTITKLPGSPHRTIKKWGIVRDKKTNEFQELYCENSLIRNYTNFIIDYPNGDIVPWNAEDPYRPNYFEKQRESNIFAYKTVESETCATWYFSKGKKFLIIGNCKSDIGIWGWEEPQLTRTLKGHKAGITSLLANEKAQELLSASRDGSVKLWCLKSFTCIRSFECETPPKMFIKPISGLCFVDRKQTLFACTDPSGCIKIWNKTSGECLFSNERPSLVSPDHDGKVFIYSSTLNLLIFIAYNCLYVCKLKRTIIFDPLELLEIFNVYDPFRCGITKLNFLDHKFQTQVVVGGSNGNMFVVDLIKKQVIWKTDHMNQGEITNIVY